MNNSNNTNSIDVKVFYEDVFTILKVISLLFYTLFFALIIKFKELRSIHIVFLLNLDVIGIFTVGAYGFLTLSIKMELITIDLCKFEALLFYFCMYLTAYGVVGLSLYRLVCVYFKCLKSVLTKFRIIISIAVIWLMPVFTVLLPVYGDDIPSYYNVYASSCRLDLRQHQTFLIFYFICANGIPTVLVMIVYWLIFRKLKQSKERANGTLAQKTTQPKGLTSKSILRIFHIQTLSVTHSYQDAASAVTDQHTHTLTQNTNKIQGQPSWNCRKAQRRLIIQLIALFVTFEVYAISNGILLFVTEPESTYATYDNYGWARILRWLYHIINPLLYLFLHPVILNKIHCKTSSKVSVK